MKRVPLETNYSEAYNQDSVGLVNLRETPIVRVTPKGIQTTESAYEPDGIIYATAFDAVTGALRRIDIRGVDGQRLVDRREGGPETYLGLQVSGFPNLFMLVGPHNGATFCNIPRCSEQNVEWVTDCWTYPRDHGRARIEATPETEAAWTEHVYDTVKHSLLAKADSWFMGANVPGKKRTFLLYAGGTDRYRQHCDEIAAAGYSGFRLG